MNCQQSLDDLNSNKAVIEKLFRIHSLRFRLILAPLITEETMDFNNYIDITPLISSEMAVFPGDQVFSRKVVMDCKKGDHLTLSSITSTVHIGAHADASNHYHKEGQGIEARSLNHYMGDCQVVEVLNSSSEVIEFSDFDIEAISSPRVLFKTLSFPDPHIWNEDFKGISVPVIKALAKKGVITVGIDTPSVDPATSKTLDAHMCIYENNLAILEGIVLTDVKPGHYNLMALPLKILDCDASPVRALLFSK